MLETGIGVGISSADWGDLLALTTGARRYANFKPARRAGKEFVHMAVIS